MYFLILRIYSDNLFQNVTNVAEDPTKSMRERSEYILKTYNTMSIKNLTGGGNGYSSPKLETYEIGSQSCLCQSPAQENFADYEQPEDGGNI